MKLLRQTSIAGLVAQLATLNNSATSSADALSVINGDVDTAGSLLKLEADMHSYADGKVDGIDLSQIDANKDAIALLNNTDDTVDGSIAKSIKTVKDERTTYFTDQFDDLQTDIGTNTSAISTLVGASDVDGSVKKAIADVINGAPEDFDTLKEIADELGDLDSAHTATLNTISTTKTDLIASIDAVNTDLQDYKTTAQGLIDDEVTARDNAITTAVNDYKAIADGKFLQISNNFSEITAETDKATARGNLGVLSESETVTKINDAKDLFKLENKTVSNGIITLPSSVSLALIDHVYIIYANNEYDTPTVIAGDNAGEYKVYMYFEGDLDDTDVEVQYIEPRYAVEGV